MKRLLAILRPTRRMSAGLLIVSGMLLLPAAKLSAAPTFAIMAPLNLGDSQPELDRFKSQLADTKSIGVQAVSVDLWWGIVQPTSQSSFDWSHYDKVFDTIRNSGLKIVPILSFHKCGGGPGDKCNIPVPDWVWGLAPDMKYKSEKGNIHDDAVSTWATKDSAVLAAFKGFASGFGSHFQAMQQDFLEVNVSLGPTGELRYPAYDPDEWSYPDRGFFQFYSDRAGTDFREWALDKFGGLSGVNRRWGLQLASVNDIRVPQNPDQFVSNQDYQNTQYGRDLIDWYNGSLVEHGRRLLMAAHESLAPTMPSVQLAMKIPGVHWQMQNTPTPRIAEITAGLVQTTKNLSATPQARSDAYGYASIMDMIAQTKQASGRNIILHFTAAEMGNDGQACNNSTSMAEALVFWISEGATDRGITHKAENALGCVDTGGGCGRSWGHITNVFKNSTYSGFTFLRLSSDNDNGCVPWNPQDRQDYANFISAFEGH